MDEKSICLLNKFQNQNLISNLDVYYLYGNVLKSTKLLSSCYKGLSLFETQEQIYISNNCVNVIEISTVNNNILTLEGHILREYSTPLCICVSNCINEGILCLLKDAYCNNIQIALQVKGIDANILSSTYAYIISFDSNVVWLNTSTTLYLVSLKEICSISTN